MFVTNDEVRIFNLIDQRAARYGYGVRQLTPDQSGILYRVVLSTPEYKHDKMITIFKDAIEQTLSENKLADAIAMNVDRELGDGNSGPFGRSA
jgi:hypothetical protein